MLAPFFLIGVGGSGGKTLRVVRREITRRLQQVGWDEGWPKSWQMLHIDVRVTDDTGTAALAEALPDDLYLGLATQGTRYPAYDQALLDPETRGAIMNWRPNPTKCRVPVTEGAGQFRTIGRVVTLASTQKITARLRDSFDELTKHDQQLARVSAKLGVTDMAANPALVIIVSSVAGGSGSGAFLDICDLAKGLNPNPAAKVYSMLYTPEVFSTLPAGARQGIEPNALAAVSELLAGQYHEGPRAEYDRALLQSSGLNFGAGGPWGPDYAFLVGRRNSRATLASDRDVFRATGLSLGVLLSDGPMQTEFTGLTSGNWEAAAGLIDTMFPDVPMPKPLSALGFASVSLGRDLFADYASGRLARHGADTLRSLGVVAEARKGGGDTSGAFRDKAAQLLPRFLVKCNLQEKGLDHDDILDALRNKEEMKSSVAAQIDKILEQAVSDGRQKKDAWRTTLLNDAVPTVRGKLTTFIEKDMREHGREWANRTLGKVVGELAQVIGQHGVPVAQALLQQLTEELVAASGTLNDEIEQLESENDGAFETARSIVASISGSVGHDDPDISKAAKYAAAGLRSEVEIAVRKLAQDLVKNLLSDVIAPLQGVLQEEGAGFQRDVEISMIELGAIPIRLYDSLPDKAVPKQLYAPPTELLMEGVETFPASFDRVVATTVPEGTAGPEAQAIAEVISGAWPQVGAAGGENPPQTLITVTGSWLPDAVKLPEEDRPVLRFSMRLVLAEIIDRAEEWVLRRDGEMSAFVSQSLRDYLNRDGSAAAKLERAGRFRALLEDALNKAEPMVKINEELRMTVHPGINPALTPSLSPIPLGPGDTGYDEALEALSVRMGAQRAEGVFSPGLGSSRIEITTQLATPVSPVVVSSLMEPIQSDYLTRGKALGDFWKWRRSRPLTSFVPLPQDVMLAAIRGWAVASLMGTVDISQRPVDRPTTILLSDEQTNQWTGASASFPCPNIRNDFPQRPANFDTMTNLLESLPLAWLEFDQREITGFRPYRQIIRLGTSPFGELKNYMECAPELEAWVQAGGDHAWAERMHPKVRAALGDAVAVRDAAAQLLDGSARYYGALFAKPVRIEDTISAEPAWELAPLIQDACEQVAKAIADIKLAGGPPPVPNGGPEW